jgi:hypothetical protein
VSAFVRNTQVVAERKANPDEWIDSISVSLTRTAVLTYDLATVQSVSTGHVTITRPDEDGEDKSLELYRDDIAWLIENLPAVLALMPEDEEVAQ